MTKLSQHKLNLPLFPSDRAERMPRSSIKTCPLVLASLDIAFSLEQLVPWTACGVL